MAVRPARETARGFPIPRSNSVRRLPRFPGGSRLVGEQPAAADAVIASGSDAADRMKLSARGRNGCQCGCPGRQQSDRRALAAPGRLACVPASP
jgi:hypothetical protein